MSSMNNDVKHISIFGIKILNITMPEALERISNAVCGHTPSRMYFVNADCLNKVFNDQMYGEVLLQADAVFGDGIGVRIASIAGGTPIVDNVNGTDMFPLLCELCVREGFSIYFLGGNPGVAERMSGRLCDTYRGLRVAGLHDGYFDKELESSAIIENINTSGADILLVAFGAPLQEKWIHEHASRIRCSVVMGVGGLFNFYSGDKPRAPFLMRKLGVEWVHRLLCDPRRLWQRYIIGNPRFIWRVFCKRITGTLQHSPGK
ncbi:WecB/TagA/CpsF family glycosyltransferase [Candidatus Hydrogenedentota bacterium]